MGVDDSKALILLKWAILPSVPWALWGNLWVSVCSHIKVLTFMLKISIITSDFGQMFSEYFGNKNKNEKEEENKKVTM